MAAVAVAAVLDAGGVALAVMAAVAAQAGRRAHAALGHAPTGAKHPQGGAAIEARLSVSANLRLGFARIRTDSHGFARIRTDSHGFAGELPMKNFFLRLRCAAAPAALSLALVAAAPTQAQILKCVDAKGNVEFSNQSCQPGWKRQELTLKENTVNSSGAREQALLEENKRLKDQLQKTSSEAKSTTEPTAPVAPVLTEADLQAQRQRSSACDDAARRYEIAAGSIAPQTELIAARRSTMFATCGIREPDNVQVITHVQTEAPRPCLLWGQRMQRSAITGLIRPVRVCLIVG